MGNSLQGGHARLSDSRGIGAADFYTTSSSARPTTLLRKEAGDAR